MDSNKEIIHLKKVESIIKESFNFETSLLESSEFIPLNMVITLLPKDKFGRDRNMNFTFIPFLNDELEHVKLIQFFSSIPDSKIEKNSNSIKDLICEINKNTVFGNFLITENDELAFRYVSGISKKNEINPNEFCELLSVYLFSLDLFSVHISNFLAGATTIEEILESLLLRQGL